MTRPTGPRCVNRRSCSRTSSPRPRIGASSSFSSGSSRKMRSICSSTVAVSRPSDSLLGSSAEKFGSLGSEPSTECMRPVTSPRRRSRVRKRSGASLNSRSASSQPSSPPRTNRCSTPSVASICWPE